MAGTVEDLPGPRLVQAAEKILRGRVAVAPININIILPANARYPLCVEDLIAVREQAFMGVSRVFDEQLRGVQS